MEQEKFLPFAKKELETELLFVEVSFASVIVVYLLRFSASKEAMAVVKSISCYCTMHHFLEGQSRPRCCRHPHQCFNERAMDRFHVTTQETDRDDG